MIPGASPGNPGPKPYLEALTSRIVSTPNTGRTTAILHILQTHLCTLEESIPLTVTVPRLKQGATIPTVVRCGNCSCKEDLPTLPREVKVEVRTTRSPRDSSASTRRIGRTPGAQGSLKSPRPLKARTVRLYRMAL